LPSVGGCCPDHIQDSGLLYWFYLVSDHFEDWSAGLWTPLICFPPPYSSDRFFFLTLSPPQSLSSIFFLRPDFGAPSAPVAVQLHLPPLFFPHTPFFFFVRILLCRTRAWVPRLFFLRCGGACLSRCGFAVFSSALRLEFFLLSFSPIGSPINGIPGLPLILE